MTIMAAQSRRIEVLFWIVFAYSALTTPCGIAQTTAPEPRFALQITNPGAPPSYALVTEDFPREQSYFYFCSDQSGFVGKGPQPSACKLGYKLQGDAVVMTLTVYFGDFDHTDIPATLRGIPHEELGPYSARVGKTVVLKQMTRFGLRPLEVKVMTPSTAKQKPPQILNEVPSAIFEFVKEDRTAYDVTVHNIGHKAMVSLYVESDNAGGGSLSQFPGAMNVDHSLVAPGAVASFKLATTPRRIASPGGYVESSKPPKVILRAALFEDGSYEGNADFAAALTAHLLATKYQWTRILDLLADIVANESLDDAAKIARIRRDVPKMSERVDPEMIAQVQSRFPNLSANGKRLVERSAAGTAIAEKARTLQSVERFARQQALNVKHGRPAGTLSDWLRLWRKENTGLIESAP